MRAPRERVFDALVSDPGTWTWFPGAKGGSYVGDKRTITAGRFTYHETVLVREAPSRFVYRVDESNSPYAKTLVEEWTTSDHPDGTLVRWTFAAEPRFVLKLPGGRFYLGFLFKRAMRNLQAQLS